MAAHLYSKLYKEKNVLMFKTFFIWKVLRNLRDYLFKKMFLDLIFKINVKTVLLFYCRNNMGLFFDNLGRKKKLNI
jgi:hypothetical protein